MMMSNTLMIALCCLGAAHALVPDFVAGVDAAYGLGVPEFAGVHARKLAATYGSESFCWEDGTASPHKKFDLCKKDDVNPTTTDCSCATPTSRSADVTVAGPHKFCLTTEVASTIAAVAACQKDDATPTLTDCSCETAGASSDVTTAGPHKFCLSNGLKSASPAFTACATSDTEAVKGAACRCEHKDKLTTSMGRDNNLAIGMILAGGNPAVGCPVALHNGFCSAETYGGIFILACPATCHKAFLSTKDADPSLSPFLSTWGGSFTEPKDYDTAVPMFSGGSLANCAAVRAQGFCNSQNNGSLYGKNVCQKSCAGRTGLNANTCEAGKFCWESRPGSPTCEATALPADCMLDQKAESDCLCKHTKTLDGKTVNQEAYCVAGNTCYEEGGILAGGVSGCQVSQCPRSDTEPVLGNASCLCGVDFTKGAAVCPSGNYCYTDGMCQTMAKTTPICVNSITTPQGQDCACLISVLNGVAVTDKKPLRNGNMQNPMGGVTNSWTADGKGKTMCKAGSYCNTGYAMGDVPFAKFMSSCAETNAAGDECVKKWDNTDRMEASIKNGGARTDAANGLCSAVPFTFPNCASSGTAVLTTDTCVCEKSTTEGSPPNMVLVQPECMKGQYCLPSMDIPDSVAKRLCSAVPETKLCPKDNKQLTEACRCSVKKQADRAAATDCDPGFYCSSVDGTCRSEPLPQLPPACAKSDTEPATAACRCAAATTTDVVAGGYCWANGAPSQIAKPPPLPPCAKSDTGAIGLHNTADCDCNGEPISIPPSECGRNSVTKDATCTCTNADLPCKVKHADSDFHDCYNVGAGSLPDGTSPVTPDDPKCVAKKAEVITAAASKLSATALATMLSVAVLATV